VSRQEQERLEHAVRATRDAEQKSNERLDQVKACKAREQNHSRYKRQLQVALQKAQERMEKLEADLSDATPDAAAIEVLEDQLNTAKQDQQNSEGVFEDIVEKKITLGDENRIHKRELEAAQREVAELEFKLTKAQGKVKLMQGKREDALKAKNKALESIHNVKENKKLWEDERVIKQADVDKTTGEAKLYAPERVPVPAGKTFEQLIDTHKRLRKTREEAEKQLGGSQLELLRKANEAKQLHKSARDEYESIGNIKNHLTRTLQHRQERWKQFRSGISVRARVTFNYLLSERRFRGTLNIDHKTHALDIHVQPDSMETAGEGRQTKTLSGGEKSFSTVCLLLSLWDAMGSPIRCLDEFDVFMDSVNRERSLDMIIAAARRSIGRQFIFITPQSMNVVQQDSDVKIIRMIDPERGQTALNFA
jgi:chromosome segregation ATPase